MHPRLTYSLAILLTIALGLTSRALAGIPPATGDALWAAMLFYGVRWLRPRQTLAQAWSISLLACWAVEASQLHQAEWLNAIRATTLGALVLGRGFLWTDLLAYAVGCSLAAFAEWGIRGRVAAARWPHHKIRG